MTSAALIARLEKAKEGSRALSDEVLLVLGWTKSKPDHWKIGEVAWKKPNGQWAGTRPHPTTSLDDAVDLVPEGWLVDMLKQDVSERWFCRVIDRRNNEDETYGCAASYNLLTPALALCICILKALETEGVDNE